MGSAGPGARAVMVLRIGLAVVVLLQTLSSGLPLIGYAAFKLGLIHPVSGPAARMIPVWVETPWWQLAVWSACVAGLLVAAWRLIRRRATVGLYLLAILTNAGLQWVMLRGPHARRLFASSTRFDYDRLALLLAVGALIWWVEQRRDRTG